MTESAQPSDNTTPISALALATAVLAQRLQPGCKALAARTAHIAFGQSRPADRSLAAGARQHRRWPAGDTGDAVPCTH